MEEQLAALSTRPLPPRIERLRELAYNLWWSWHEEAQGLYRNLDPLLWEKLGHNPVALLRRITQDRLEIAAGDTTYLATFDKVFRAFDSYMHESDTWFATTYPDLRDQTIAYFSTEFGVHESLPLYAGGLGVLSGDHTKEASDLGLPFVGIGLLYHKGYFTQKINVDGWQEDVYNDFDPADRPIKPVFSPDGKAIRIPLDLGSLQITSALWKVQVGRVCVYLLDTDLESNSPDIIADLPRLYGGSHLTRLLQEILLGIGGVKVLRTLGVHPQVWHMNEGHSSFLTLELVREQVMAGMPVNRAIDAVKSMSVFTTHTPVPAGLDMFDLDMLTPYFQSLCDELGATCDQVLNLGRQDIGWGEKFSMPRLALQLSWLHNGVSKLHGEVSRDLFQSVWPDREAKDVPIFHITNGVHAQTWLAPQLISLFDEYVGRDWVYFMDDPSLWDAIDAIPDVELWAVRRHLKRKMVIFANERARKLWQSGSVNSVQVIAGGVLLDPYSLTIGFARRFATYKRANLILRDFDRLMNLINNPNMPVQIIFAGKAHPADEPGKLLIQQVYRSVKDSRMGGRLVFLEDYDMNVARYLVQGVDVWMNTPRRPNEASGTSGEKAAMNGVLNFSVLDGWWREGFNGENGWAIGTDTDMDDNGQQDAVDAESLYSTLENEIVPLFYHRSADNLPNDWIAKVKETIKTLGPQFNTRRMLKEYMSMMYQPAIAAESDDRALSVER